MGKKLAKSCGIGYVQTIEKGKKLLVSPKHFFLSLPVEKEIIINMYSLKKLVDPEFVVWWFDSMRLL